MSKAQRAVLVIDDEPHIRRFVRAGFEQEGFCVREAGSAAAGLTSVADEKPDLIILDLGLPDMHGDEVLERVRASSSVPIIVFSVEADERQKVHLLRLGADDYVVKPCGIGELLARADATLRRYVRGAVKASIVRAGPLSMDLVTHVVMLGNARVRLTRKEYSLLRALAADVGVAVPHQQLLKEIWGVHHLQKTQYLRILVRQTRSKIEVDPGNPKILTTESGVGYRLEVSVDEDRTNNETIAAAHAH